MVGEHKVILHAYWASSCTWRVRAGLKIKNIAHEEKHYEILKLKQHLTEQFRALNPTQKVPALEVDGQTFIESMAILQYLEETRPQPSLLPSTPVSRARMREICEVIVSGIQPLQNVSLKDQTEDQFESIALHYTARGLQSVEDLVSKTSGGRFCVGDQLSMADLCLVPQVYNAITRRKLDISVYPTVDKIYKHLIELDVFKSTHPKLFKPTDKI